MQATLSTRLNAPETTPVPGAHLGLTWRTVQAADRDAIIELTQITEEENKVVRRTPVSQLVSFVDESIEGTYADALIGVDSRGDVQAFGLVRLYREDFEVARAELFAATMPRWRGRGIGRALLTWQDARARQLLVSHWGADSTLPARISNVVEAHQRDRRQLYAAAGFTPTSLLGVYRHDLQVLPSAQTTDVRPLQPADLEQVRTLHHLEAIGRGVSTAQANRWWQRVSACVNFGLSYVALDESQDINAYALVCRHSVSWLAGVDADASIEAKGPEGSLVLDRVLMATLQRAKDEGFTGLSTEAEVQTIDGGSSALERLGFNKIGLRMVYTVDL